MERDILDRDYKSGCKYRKFELCLLLPIIAIVAVISAAVLSICKQSSTHETGHAVNEYYSEPIEFNVQELSGSWLTERIILRTE